jgi:Fe/S biogenesis protein NfuA
LLTISEKAIEEIRSLMDEAGEDDIALRVAVLGRGPGGFRYDLAFVNLSDRKEDDIVVDVESFQVFIDSSSAPNLEGARIDFQTDDQQAGFRIENPNTGWKDPLASRVQQILDTRINPSVAMHGGFITLVDVRDEVAYIRMEGGCQGCGLAMLTLKDGVEAQLMTELPELKGIVDTTDHAVGGNPFYQPSEEGESPVA